YSDGREGVMRLACAQGRSRTASPTPLQPSASVADRRPATSVMKATRNSGEHVVAGVAVGSTLDLAPLAPACTRRSRQVTKTRMLAVRYRTGDRRSRRVLAGCISGRSAADPPPP